MNMKSSSFSDMPISEGMKITLQNLGFAEPTPIQEKSIPELLMGRDLIGQAQTGTGKTASFGIPLIEMIDEKDRKIRALVVCPTRELCLQVCDELRKLSPSKPHLSIEAIYGGQSIDRQFKALKDNKPQIIVATPGRLFDHIRRESLNLSTVSMVVLDEADEMLDMGFRPEIEQIFDMLPEENQRIFFSATMPKEIKDLAVNYLRSPALVKTESKSLTAAKIEQTYLRCRARDKSEVLCRLLEQRDPKLAIVFCNAKSTVDELVSEIKFRGYEAAELHGDLSQNQRDKVMSRFKNGNVRVLVATDVAARGIDIEDVEMVVNYHLPQDPEDYVHRIGRTGRAGRHGFAISLVEPRDNSRLRRIEQIAKVSIKEIDPPTLSQIKDAKIVSLFQKIREAINERSIAHYRTVVAQSDMDSNDVAAGMLHLALVKLDKMSQEIDSPARDGSDKSFSANKRGSGNRGGGFERFGDRGGRSGGYRDNRDSRPPRRDGGDRDRGGERRFSEPKYREGGFGGDRMRRDNRGGDAGFHAASGFNRDQRKPAPSRDRSGPPAPSRDRSGPPSGGFAGKKPKFEKSSSESKSRGGFRTFENNGRKSAPRGGKKSR